MDKPVRQARLILAGLIAGFGVVLLVLMVHGGSLSADSALLFVGLPVMLAAALTLAPVRTTHGRVFQVTTICLLLTAVAAHEGAICVILAAPLVYGVAHGVTALARLATRRRAYVIALPLLLLPAVEGVDPQWRVDPVQSVEVVRTVALTESQVAQRIAGGPKPTAMASAALRLLGMPAPQRVEGAGLAPGSRWMFAYHGTSHGPGGHTVFEVSRHAAGTVTFAAVDDTAITARWFRWRSSTITWYPVADGRTHVRLTVEYERRLDPSWYFGPLNDVLLHEGGAHLLDMLALK